LEKVEETTNDDDDVEESRSVAWRQEGRTRRSVGGIRANVN